MRKFKDKLTDIWSKLDYDIQEYIIEACGIFCLIMIVLIISLPLYLVVKYNTPWWFLLYIIIAPLVGPLVMDD